jgi:hypothetical protein
VLPTSARGIVAVVMFVFWAGANYSFIRIAEVRLVAVVAAVVVTVVAKRKRCVRLV